MAYTPPTQQQILADGINTYASLNPAPDDMNRGSVVRSLLTSHSIMLKQAYISQSENAQIMQQIGMYQAFNFNRLQPVAAYTMEQVTAAAPASAVTVPSGTIFGVQGTNTQYQTIANFIWPAGATTESIRIVCTQTGTIGNTPAGTITNLVTPITGLTGVAVTNVKAVINGAGLETDEARATRFADYKSSLHRGDVAALGYGATQAVLYDQYGYITERVVKVMVVEGIGSNTIYIDNGTYDTSSALVTQCQQVINGYYDSSGNPVMGYKAAGIPATVQAANIQGVAIAASLTPDTGYTLPMLDATINVGLAALVQGLNVGGTLYGATQGQLLLSAIGLIVGNVAGVLNYVITSPTADITPAAGTLLQLTDPHLSLI